MSKKLSGQPFLVVQFFQQAKEDVDTRVKGWREKSENIVNYERAFVVDRVSSKDASSPVIINLVNGEVVNNAVNKPNDELVAHYIAKYEDMIKESLRVWVNKEVFSGVTGFEKKGGE